VLIEFICHWFSPCPLCYKCRNVNDALYSRCKKCAYSVGKCKHTDAQINKMIKRKNFRLNIGDDWAEDFRKLEEEAHDKE
jgi:hypothetical protein